MVAAASVYTTPPLRKVFDVTLTAAGDTGTVAIAHGINFTDVATNVPPLITELICEPFGTAPAYGAVPSINAIDGTNVTLAFNPAIAGVVRAHIQRMHSVQG